MGKLSLFSCGVYVQLKVVAWSLEVGQWAEPVAKEVQAQLCCSVTDMAAEPAESHYLAGQLSGFEFRAKMG